LARDRKREETKNLCKTVVTIISFSRRWPWLCWLLFSSGLRHRRKNLHSLVAKARTLCLKQVWPSENLEETLSDIKEAWEAAKLRAGRILKGIPEGTKPEQKTPPLVCRFHDLRHTAVSRMLNAGIPIAKVAKIVGWSPATMVRMAARYGHFSLNELRGAVESISRAEIQPDSPVFSNAPSRASKLC
jgi:Phage integrase family